MIDVQTTLTEDGSIRYIGRKCKPKCRSMLFLPYNLGYFQLDTRQEWEMEYVPKHNTCFMRHKQFHLKINTETFAETFDLTHDPGRGVLVEMIDYMMGVMGDKK